MAKSIFLTLDDLETETSVPAIKDSKGKVLRESFGDVLHTIPRKLFPTSEQFENADLLLAWSNENGFTHFLLQKSIQKGLIEIRATFKGLKKDDTWSTEYGQANVDRMEWSETKRPKSKKSDASIATDYMKNLSPEGLAELLASLKA